MYIKRIHMRGYKRFHDLTIDLGEHPRRIVALVGPNGCGKSSVLDAMMYLYKAYAGSVGEVSNMANENYRYHSLRKDPKYKPQNIEIQFDKGDLSTVFNKRHSAGEGRSMISFRSSYRYNSHLQVTESRAVDEIRLNNYGASSASDIDQRIEVNYRRLLAKYNHYRDDNDVRPSEAMKHIVGDLNTALKGCLELEVSDLGNIEANEGTLHFKKSDSDIIFEYNVLSAGEKEVLDLILDLYVRKDTYTDAIYIFDEPELHLNTVIQRSLLLEINKIIPENCQIWIATHSIGFLRAIQEELKGDSQIIEFKGENRWASEAYTLRPAAEKRSMWQSIFSTALDDLAKLICPKTIIYCEGRAEPRKDGSERGLDANVFNTIFAAEYPDVLFVSSGGNTELDQRSDIALAIFSKVFPDLQIWVLKDRDMASGKDTDENSRKIYLENNSDNHRVLRRFEIENYLYDKAVLESYCEDKGLRFDNEKYDLIVTDITNQNLKDQTGAIKGCCNISTSLNQEKFKLNLSNYILKTMDVYKELEEVIFQRK